VPECTGAVATNADWLDRYLAICLRRVWKAQRFSCSREAMASLAEQYVGLPLDVPPFESVGVSA
jgi:hypothetical protein